MTALRVALLSRRWSTSGGNERVAVELMRQLAMRGHHVDVYAHRVDARVDSSGCRVHRTWGIAFDPTLAALSYRLYTDRLVRRLRKERTVDVVVGFGPSVVQDVYRLGGGTHAEFIELSSRRRALRSLRISDRVALALEARRFLPENSPILIAVSHRVKDELRRHYDVDPARVTVIWNGIDLDRFSPRAATQDERERTRARWKVAFDEPVLLFVGQDPLRKGLEFAAEAAARLNVRLVWVGRGSIPHALPGSVVHDGERQDVQACYRAADVLVLPSWYDPFGGVVLEGLACGLLPVATRRVGATERLLNTPLDALLVDEPDDVDALVRAITCALDPSKKRELLGHAAKVRETAGRDAWGSAMEAVIRGAASQRAAS